MQQAIYNRIAIHITKTSKTAAMGSRRVGLARWIMQSWDLCGVLALMASSAAYGVYAIAHVV